MRNDGYPVLILSILYQVSTAGKKFDTYEYAMHMFHSARVHLRRKEAGQRQSDVYVLWRQISSVLLGSQSIEAVSFTIVPKACVRYRSLASRLVAAAVGARVPLVVMKA